VNLLISFHLRGDIITLTYGSIKTPVLSKTASTASTKHPNVPSDPVKHFPILSFSHLTRYTSNPDIAVSSLKLAKAAIRCLSASGKI
jgi:hypothetical protein